jgi:hypothetical protein
MIENAKIIINLISSCIYLDHPIVLDIRWQFHVSLSEIDNLEQWESREKWEKLIKSYKYTVFTFLRDVFQRSSFRKDIVTVLEYEIMNLTNKKMEMSNDKN